MMTVFRCSLSQLEVMFLIEAFLLGFAGEDVNLG